jgi:hypothetical protein
MGGYKKLVARLLATAAQWVRIKTEVTVGTLTLVLFTAVAVLWPSTNPLGSVLHFSLINYFSFWPALLC